MRMERGNAKRIPIIWWLTPLLIGVLSSAFVLLADPSAMSLWCLRSFAANSVAVCLLGHFIAMAWLFVRRRWKSGFIALVISPLFFMIAFLVTLKVGPDIESVTAKVSAVTAVPQSEIKCLGGWLQREPILVFELPNEIPLKIDNADVIEQNNILLRLTEYAGRLNVRMPSQAKVLRYRSESDTVFVAYDADHRLAFFFGMIVM